MITSGPVSTAIEGMSTKDAKAYILAQFDAMPIPEPYDYTDTINGIPICIHITVTYKNIEIMQRDSGVTDSVLMSEVAITIGGEPVPTSADAFFCANPPYLIPDGTFETATDPAFPVANLVENLPEAYKQSLGQAVAMDANVRATYE